MSKSTWPTIKNLENFKNISAFLTNETLIFYPRIDNFRSEIQEWTSDSQQN